MATDYIMHAWVNMQDPAFDENTDPKLNATNLNEMEAGIDTAHSELVTHEADADVHLTSDQNAAFDGAAAPSVTNVLATMDNIGVDIEAHTALTDAHHAQAHLLGSHTADTLANLNAKVTDATLIDTDDSRLSDARVPTAHASSHTNGTDDIQSATNAVKGLATAAHITTLEALDIAVDQSVISGASPTFDGVNITNVDADTLIVDIKEANVSAIAKGQVCAIIGSSGSKFEVRLCDCDDGALIRVLGIAVADTALNAVGQVVYKGLLTNVDTQITNTNVNPNGETWLAGDMLFVSNTAGGLSNVRPTSGRCIKAGRTLKGNSASDTLLAIIHTNDICACAAADEDLCNRMGDNAGVNKCRFKDYDNNEVAAFDSNGNLTLIGNVDGRDVSVDGTKLDTVENRATAIENDIDYPTAVKQKAITDTGEDGGVEGGVFNGDFEYGSESQSNDGWIGDEDYGWYQNTNSVNATASYDNGRMKCVIDAAGVFSEILQGYSVTIPTKQIPLLPSTKYRLSGYIELSDISGDSSDGVFIALVEFDSSNSSITASNTPKHKVNTDRIYIEKIFTSNASADKCRIIASFYGHTGTGTLQGTAWFDNIKLEQIDTQAVNTQVDEIVSVSVEGVTTTDNIDQYLETSGNTYTLTTGVDEGATHRQTFTPTADRGDGKHLLTKIQALVAAVGTGDWTLVVHDAANNVLASKLIANASMSTGDIDFDIPVILDVGTAYHFHIYSTVADGTVTTTDNADLETVDYHAQFTKHTESPIVKANGSTLDMTGVKLLTGATITVNADGSGRYEFTQSLLDSSPLILSKIHNVYDTNIVNPLITQSNNITQQIEPTVTELYIIYKINLGFCADNVRVIAGAYQNSEGTHNISVSINNDIYSEIVSFTGTEYGTAIDTEFEVNSSTVYIKIAKTSANDYFSLRAFTVTADIDCQAALPIFSPSTEVTTETSDLTLNPIDISEDGYWKLKSDLTGWGSRTFTMLASEAAFESQAVSANYIYMYDSNGTTPWTCDERSGLVPPADRISGTVTAKFLVGDNQIRSSVNDGSMKANVNLSWNAESLRAAINRLTELANLQYPIVIEVEDVPAIDLQDQPTGASAETGYTNDVTSLRQTTAGVAAIIYTGLLPRENQFSEWLDITVVCSDGDGTLQGKLYTVDGTLIETYADLESNPVITISNPDYKYSRERLILQISANLETTSTAWSVTDIKWRYQYNG